MIRDGLPGLSNGEGGVVEGGVVDGHLLYAKPEKETELQSVIKLFETPEVYQLHDVEVIKAPQICVHATASFFKKLRRVPKPNDEPFESSTWSVSDDVYFQYGLPTLFKMAHESRTNGGPGDSPHFWQEYLPIMGTFLNLWTVLERYVAFAKPAITGVNRVEGQGENVKCQEDHNVEKITMLNHLKALQKSDIGEKALNKVISKPTDRIHKSDGGGTPVMPGKVLENWYQIRNNSAHRGKSAYSDYRKVREAALGLSEFLVTLLSQEVNGLEHLQEHLTDSYSSKS